MSGRRKSPHTDGERGNRDETLRAWDALARANRTHDTSAETVAVRKPATMAKGAK